ncbi:PLDc N-terminal domain-containing protein [Rhodococcoides kroppenstedtii]|uniref:PLDc N-terminal domain-containing protein n=1 Tax=Rhodococcoides kroppenstedtii TaxID=293050 RepID=UPI001BDF0940|nr:PLDc N-terminal domain-containing protein [Rhodococcus kroppenstedtii]MBT1194052.1 PLDc N-terminal domain-containing protein [Rhodococcus kroppenstedtii]
MELAGIVIVALFIVAAVSIGRARHIGVLVKIGWLVIVVVLPVLGPILWFAVGQRYAFRVNGEARL